MIPRIFLASVVLALPAFAQSTLIPVPDRRAHVFDAGRRILYVTTERGVLERYDVVADQLLAPVPLGTRLNGLDITPDGRFLYVAEDERSGDDGLVYRVDLETLAATTLSFPLRDIIEDGTWQVVIGSAGKALLTTHPCQFCSGFAYMRQLDLASGAISRRLDVTFGDISDRTHLARGADRSRILVMGGNSSAGPTFTYVCGSDTFTPERSLSDYLSGVGAVNRDGTRLAVQVFPGTKIFDSAVNALHTLTGRYGGVIFDPLRDLMYQVDHDADELIAYETATFGEVDRIAAGEGLVLNVGGPLGDDALSIGPAGDFIFVSSPLGVREIVVGPIAPAVLASTADRVPHDEVPGQVLITGRFFAQGTGTRVFFGAGEASAVQVVDDHTLLATPPSGAPGPVDVRVTNSAGEGVLRDGFVYTPGVRVRGLAELGQRLWVDYLTTPNGGVLALYGPGPAVSLPTGYGVLCIAPPLRLFRLAPSPLTSFTLAIDIPPSSSLVGTTLLLQALVGTSPAQAHFTNCAAVTIH